MSNNNFMPYNLPPIPGTRNSGVKQLQNKLNDNKMDAFVRIISRESFQKLPLQQQVNNIQRLIHSDSQENREKKIMTFLSIVPDNMRAEVASQLSASQLNQFSNKMNQATDDFSSIAADNKNIAVLDDGTMINTLTGKAIDNEDILIEADILKQKGNLDPVEQAWVQYADAKINRSQYY